LHDEEQDLLPVVFSVKEAAMNRIALKVLLCVASLSVVPAADASVIHFTALLSGANESPTNSSQGTGVAFVDIDTLLNTMVVSATFSGLTGNTTVSHIHCCTTIPDAGTANVATTTPSFPGFPLGVTSGTYLRTFDLTLASSYNPAFVTASGGTVAAAEAALLAGMVGERTYFNIHTSVFPAGEIRGFLRAVPEPWTLGLIGAGGIGAWLGRRRRVPA